MPHQFAVFILCVQIPAPCTDNIVKLVTVEQSCRILTGSLFKECNSQVSNYRQTLTDQVRCFGFILFTLYLCLCVCRWMQSLMQRCVWRQHARAHQWVTASVSVMLLPPMHRLAQRVVYSSTGDQMIFAVSMKNSL